MLQFVHTLLLCSLFIVVASAKSRVLFLMDGIHSDTISGAASQLRKDANSKVISNIPNTHELLEKLDGILESGKWDLIYFSYGTEDLVYRDPRSKQNRVMSKYSGGVITTTPDQYEKNLQEIVRRLRKTKAKLVWGSIIPMVTVNGFPSYRENIFDQGAHYTRKIEAN